MRLIDALRGENKGRPPIWLMRQAGRYLPEYRLLREKHSLYEMFFTPSIAATVTLMPIERFDFDAAILFSDITAIAPALGLALSFHEGPTVTPSLTPQNFESCPVHMHRLEPIFETVRLVKQKASVPLIGFCGGPFTVATYLVEEEALALWMKKEPESFARFIDWLTDVSIQYLKGQIKAGVDALQVFDSWANKLSGEEFERYSLQPIKKIIQAVDRPVIVYMRGSALRAESLAAIGPAAISVDEGRPLAEVRQLTDVSLQGNIRPEVLFSSPEIVREETQKLLKAMGQDPGFIVNLSHGILPKTPLDSVAALVDTVKNYF